MHVWRGPAAAKCNSWLTFAAAPCTTWRVMPAANASSCLHVACTMPHHNPGHNPGQQPTAREARGGAKSVACGGAEGLGRHHQHELPCMRGSNSGAVLSSVHAWRLAGGCRKAGEVLGVAWGLHRSVSARVCVRGWRSGRDLWRVGAMRCDAVSHSAKFQGTRQTTSLGPSAAGRSYPAFPPQPWSVECFSSSTPSHVRCGSVRVVRFSSFPSPTHTPQ